MNNGHLSKLVIKSLIFGFITGTVLLVISFFMIVSTFVEFFIPILTPGATLVDLYSGNAPTYVIWISIFVLNVLVYSTLYFIISLIAKKILSRKAKFIAVFIVVVLFLVFTGMISNLLDISSWKFVSGQCVLTRCNYFHDQSSCEHSNLKYDCKWVENFCTDDPNRCSQFINESSCLKRDCKWVQEAICYPGGKCDKFFPAEGCSTCFEFKDQNSCENGGCDWGISYSCLGHEYEFPSKCSPYENISSCELAGCKWKGIHCDVKDVCRSIENKKLCKQNPECSWI